MGIAEADRYYITAAHHGHSWSRQILHYGCSSSPGIRCEWQPTNTCSIPKCHTTSNGIEELLEIEGD